MGLKLYAFIAELFALFGHRKARHWIRGQRLWMEQLNSLPEDKDIIWMHCASLGEFEQGRPLMQSIQEEREDLHFVLSFFSPSGFEQIQKEKQEFTCIYLPLDTRANAETLIYKIQPCLALFIKYEFWINHLECLHRTQVPFFLISAVLSEKHLSYPIYGTYLRRCLSLFDHIFVQDRESFRLLKGINVPATISGDTRIDRVLRLPEEAKSVEFPSIESWVGHRKLLLCGSTWPEDERLLFDYLDDAQVDDLAVLLVPHDIGEQHLQWIENHSPCRTIRYSALGEQDHVAADQIISVDSIGLLSRLYKLADIAYVGGAFKSGLHNILEPAAFRIPIIFGPDYQSFPEAASLANRGAAWPIEDAEQLGEVLDHLRKKEVRERIKIEISSYLQGHSGATERIMNYLKKEDLIK